MAALLDIGPGLERTLLVAINVTQLVVMAWLTARYELNARRRPQRRYTDRGRHG